MKLTPASLALIAAVLSAGPAAAADYVIDTDKAHASINFRIKHLGFSWLTGRFDTFKGTFAFDAANPSGQRVDGKNLNFARGLSFFGDLGHLP